MRYICGLYTIDMGDFKQSRVIRAYRVLDTGTMEMKYYRDLSVVSCVTGMETTYKEGQEPPKLELSGNILTIPHGIDEMITIRFLDANGAEKFITIHPKALESRLITVESVP